MSERQGGIFEFGRFVLDTRRRRLLRDGHAVRLTPKAFDVLCLLVQNQGRVVEKTEILDVVWPNTAVEEGNLTVNISLIRRALGESRTEHPFIVTVPGRGYQFVGDVRDVTTAPAGPVPAAAGVTEVSPSLPQEPPQEPAATGVAAHPRIAWGFGQRLVLSAAIVAGLALPFGLPRSERPDRGANIVDAEAHSLYLRGRLLLSRRTEESLTKAQDYFERAIERAPKYVAAHAGLADAHATQGYFGLVPPAQAYIHAHSAASTALDLDPDSAEANTSLAYILHRFAWDWTAAERRFRRAIALDPDYALAHHWYAAFLESVGRRDEAIAEARRAETLDPLNPVITANLNAMLRPDSSRDFFERGNRLIELEPVLWLSHLSAGNMHLASGDRALSIVEYERAADLAGRRPYALTNLGVAYATAGRSAQARATLREMDVLDDRRYLSAYARVPILAALGDNDEAFAWLDRALGERSAQLPFARLSLARLESDPRFRGLLAEVGLPPLR